MIRRVGWLILLGNLVGIASSWGAEPSPTSSSPQSSDVDQILARESMKLDSLLSPESRIPDRPELDTRITALDGGNFDSLGAPFRGPDGISLSAAPGRWSMFNRVEGVRAGFGLDARLTRGLRFTGDGGYAFAAHRWVGQTSLSAGRRRTGPMLRLSAVDRMESFGPNPVGTGAAFLSLVAGQDRQDYLRRREVGLWFSPLRKREGDVWIGAWLRDDRSARAMTDYHFFGGGTPMESPNPEIDEVEQKGATAKADWHWGGDLLKVAARADVGALDSAGDEEFAAQQLELTVRPIVPAGTLSLSVGGRNMAGDPPVQEEPYLGGDGNLRGYGRLEFTGRRRLTGRFEYELGIDILKRAGIPLLRDLQLQFIPFVDVGTSWGEGRGVSSTRVVGLNGSPRSSLGLGIRREVWLPGVRAIRLDLIHRADGSDDPTHFWFRFIPY